MGGKSGKKKRIRMENGGKWKKERGTISPLLGEIRRNSPIVRKKLNLVDHGVHLRSSIMAKPNAK